MWRAPGRVGHRIERSQDGTHDGERREERGTSGRKLGGRRARSWTWCCACCEARSSKSSAGRWVWKPIGMAAWRDEFLDAGKEGLKGKRATTEEDRRLRDAERKIGELTLENEIWKKVAEKRGLQMPPQKRPR